MEEFGPHCYKEQRDGHLLFEMDYTDEDSLVGWLLTFGEKARVMEPDTVREKLRKTAESIAAIYGKEGEK